MTGDTVGKVSADYRRKRIKKIKRIIILICVLLLILPSVLATYLLFRVHQLENRLDRMILPTETVAATGPAATDDTEAASGSAASGSGVTTTPAPIGEGKKVYLTFDDGPGPNTKKILDILKKQGVKGTFFVTGKTDDFSKQMYKRIIKEGHTLGMHSYSHLYDEIYASEKAFSQDLDKIYEYLHDVTGEYPEFYRFPGGSSVQETKVPIEKLVKVLDKKKITYLDWNVLSPDIRDTSVDKKQLVSEIKKDIEKYDTSVVLFYDTQTQPMTVKALPSVIKSLKKDGYEILPVDADTAPIRHNQ